MGLLLITDIWEETLPDKNQVIELDAYALTTATLTNNSEGSLSVVQNTWYIAILATLSVGVAFFEIFRYRNRLAQLKLGLLNVLLMVEY